MIKLQHVTYTYPFQETPAVRDLSLAVNPGEVTLVTGASGCGKSTLIRLVNGLCPHFFQGTLEGEIRLNGISSTGKTLAQLSAEVGTVFQDPEMQFFALNVDDEIAFAHEWLGKPPEEIQEVVKQTAEQLNITHILDSSIHDLSEGQKQKVALADILSLSPSMVVLDEPSANLDPESTDALAQLIRDLKNRGIAVLVVDHRLYWLKGVADHVVVMDNGEIVAQGEFDMLGDAALRARYGLRAHHVPDTRQTLPPLPKSGHLEVEGLTFGHGNGPTLYDNASFALPQGVTGIIGDNGTGKTTLARLLTGLTKPRSGNIAIGGDRIKQKKLLNHAGIVLQNTDHQLHMNSVFQEVAMASGTHRVRNDNRDTLIAFLDRFGLAHLANRHPQSLSGGEKQRLVIACGLAQKPDIFILDEPTSGLDGHNMERIAAMMREAADSGTSVVVITHDLELLHLACDVALRLPFSQDQQESSPCLKTA